MTVDLIRINFTEGYTSISVREPLANIRAQTKEINKLQRDLDPHYSTVSDDSGRNDLIFFFANIETSRG